MKSKFFLQLIICISAIWAMAAQAAPVKPSVAEAWADKTGRELLDTFRDPVIARRYENLDRIFRENIDMDYVSRFVIGKYWRKMTDEQKAAYQGIFARYALSTYKTFPLNFLDSISYKVTGATAETRFTTVTAVIHVRLNPEQPPQDFVLYFRLHEVSGKILLVDIKLAESSLILVYRNKFYEQIAALEGEIDWFLEDLETQTLSNENNNRRKLELSQE